MLRRRGWRDDSSHSVMSKQKGCPYRIQQNICTNNERYGSTKSSSKPFRGRNWGGTARRRHDSDEDWNGNPNGSAIDRTISELLFDETIPNQYKTAFQQQMKLGWEHLFMGKMASGWKQCWLDKKHWCSSIAHPFQAEHAGVSGIAYCMVNVRTNIK